MCLLSVASISGAGACGERKHHWAKDRPAPAAESTPAPVDDPPAPPLPPAPPAPPAPAPIPPRPRPAPQLARVAAEPRRHVRAPAKPHEGPPSFCGPRGHGDHYFVRGVAPSDVLNIREKPDWKSAVAGAIPPNATGVVASNERAVTAGSIWRRVTCGKIEGWVNERFLAREPGVAPASTSAVPAPSPPREMVGRP